MSTLRTYNIQNPDSASVNIELTSDGGAVASGILTTSQLNVGTGGTVITTTSSGLVGVGTEIPGSKIHLSAASGTLQMQISNGGNPTYIGHDSAYTGFDIAAGGGIRFRYHTGAAYATAAVIDTSGNLNLSAAGTKVLNSSGNPILQQTGSILQVIQTSKTDTFYSSTAETWYDITGMSATITPTSSTSKILVEFNLGKVAGLNNNVFRIMRNGSLMPGAGAAAGNRQQAHFTDSNQSKDGNHTGSLSYAYLDSPSSTSAVTYQLQVRAEVISSQGFGLNRTYSDTDATQGYNARCSSTVILMEVAA